MTLIVTLLAAIAASAAWRAELPGNAHRFGGLALMYWAAALMWCVDGVANLLEGETFIELADPAAMADDALLGAVVVACGLAVWAVVLAAWGRKTSTVTPATR